EDALFGLLVQERAGAAQLLSEFVATFGLVTVIRGCGPRQATAFAVGAYIAAAYWFTASTSFANPAVTLARATTDTFAGIRPVDAPGFIAAQVLGAATAAGLLAWLRPAAAEAPRGGPPPAGPPRAPRHTRCPPASRLPRGRSPARCRV